MCIRDRYEPRAFLFGSKRDLFHTREEVRAYFEGFPAGMLRKARCYDQHAHALGHDVIITAGYVCLLYPSRCV